MDVKGLIYGERAVKRWYYGGITIDLRMYSKWNTNGNDVLLGGGPERSAVAPAIRRVKCEGANAGQAVYRHLRLPRRVDPADRYTGRGVGECRYCLERRERMRFLRELVARTSSMENPLDIVGGPHLHDGGTEGGLEVAEDGTGPVQVGVYLVVRVNYRIVDEEEARQHRIGDVEGTALRQSDDFEKIPMDVEESSKDVRGKIAVRVMFGNDFVHGFT